MNLSMSSKIATPPQTLCIVMYQVDTSTFKDSGQGRRKLAVMAMQVCWEMNELVSHK